VTGGSGEAMIHAFASRSGIVLPSGAAARLEALGELLVARAIPLGLVASSDAERVYDRHVLDCLRAALVFRPEDRTAYDLGSGGGLPGLVLAAALPGCRFLLIESKRRAAAFLELARERLNLENVEILILRAQEVEAPADVVTARAFAPLQRTWGVAWPLLRPGGRLVYFAGEGFDRPEAASLGGPEPPAGIEVAAQVDSSSPLVIMSRKG
jgi:16S rRNA (guanine527-N7)-methyltransferase